MDYSWNKRIQVNQSYREPSPKIATMTIYCNFVTPPNNFFSKTAGLIVLKLHLAYL